MTNKYHRLLFFSLRDDVTDKPFGLLHLLLHVGDRLHQVLPHEDGRFTRRGQLLHLLAMGHDFKQLLAMAFAFFHLHFDCLHLCLQLLHLLSKIPLALVHMSNALMRVSLQFNQPTVEFLHVLTKVCRLVLFLLTGWFCKAFASPTPQPVEYKKNNLHKAKQMSKE